MCYWNKQRASILLPYVQCILLQNCGNTVDDSKKGMEKLVDIHNLIFMPKLDDYSNVIVDVERLGKNKFH